MSGFEGPRLELRHEAETGGTVAAVFADIRAVIDAVERDREHEGARSRHHPASGKPSIRRDYPWRVDRDAIVRRRRHEQALEALEFERERERALADQIGAVVVERDGRRVDEEVFERMETADVALVRELLDGASWSSEEGAGFDDEPDIWLTGDDAEQGEDDEEEIRRLEEEIVACRGRQLALERYIAALGL